MDNQLQEFCRLLCVLNNNIAYMNTFIFRSREEMYLKEMKLFAYYLEEVAKEWRELADVKD